MYLKVSKMRKGFPTLFISMDFFTKENCHVFAGMSCICLLLQVCDVGKLSECLLARDFSTVQSLP